MLWQPALSVSVNQNYNNNSLASKSETFSKFSWTKYMYLEVN